MSIIPIIYANGIVRRVAPAILTPIHTACFPLSWNSLVDKKKNDAEDILLRGEHNSGLQFMEVGTGQFCPGDFGPACRPNLVHVHSDTAPSSY
jgi:hypothetical protein